MGALLFFRPAGIFTPMGDRVTPPSTGLFLRPEPARFPPHAHPLSRKTELPIAKYVPPPLLGVADRVGEAASIFSTICASGLILSPIERALRGYTPIDMASYAAPGMYIWRDFPDAYPTPLWRDQRAP